MARLKGNPQESSWRSCDSFWARVALVVYGENEVKVRKTLYNMWKQNRRDLRKHYSQQQELIAEREKAVETRNIEVIVIDPN